MADSYLIYLFYYTNFIFYELQPSKSTYIDGNRSDIFITYSGHSEVKDPVFDAASKPIEKKNYIPQPKPETTEFTKAVEDVIFIPNDKSEVRTDDEYLENDSVKIADVVDGRKMKIGDVMRDSSATEKANEDVLFISGKNNENEETDKKSDRKTKHNDSLSKTKEKPKKLDCSNLDCDNTVKSICGEKADNKKAIYRLFLNECFFRKVNCAFKYPNNRYKKVTMDKCKHIGYRSKERPVPPIDLPLTHVREETRRSFSSRRSLNKDVNGLSCTHPCPVTCTDKYEPQCAMSTTGELKTFLNHCKLDYQSCLNNVVWRVRPLSECVGGRKADMRQNRGFIAWMQKVGIVDRRGRLVLA